MISAYEKPMFFVDEQVRGPFRRWRHEHHFEEVAGGTRMVDIAEFSSPARPVGRLVDRVALTAYMAKLLEQRNAHLKAALEV
jgi:ligand-binding SRPBCC domain-containing protein